MFVRLVVLGGLAYLIVRSLAFLAQPGYPAGYWYDLGAHAIATGYESATIRTLSDVLDCIGWAAWSDVPQFVYNPMTTSVVLVTMTKFGAGIALALKLCMVGQIWFALVSMAVLYRTFRRSWTWALLAGLLYALFPATALQIASNLDLGFIVALAPLALALCIRLIRRFGPLGLPLAGAVCGWVAQAFATEYFLVVSLPLFAVVALSARSSKKWLVWAVASCAGVAAAVGVGLYCIVPTFAASAVVTSPATRITDIEGGLAFVQFAESLTALWHGVLTESTQSPFPEFNVSSHLWATSIALTIVWWAAIGFAVRRIRRGAIGRWQAVLVGVLVLLAFGSTIPFAASFWLITSRIPFLQLLRTPDRLAVVPFIFLALWSVAILHSIARLPRKRSNLIRQSATPAALLALCSFAYFDFVSGVLIVRPDTDYRLPGLERTNAVVQRRPAPVLTYAFINQGSILDTPLYGLGVPTRAIGQDLLSRFGAEPAHAIGVLRKAGIRTLVTTPLWTVDGGYWPDLGIAFAGSPMVRRVSGSPLRAAVWSVLGPAADVSRVRLACLHGGPGALDEIALLPQLADAAIVTGNAPCSLDVYANSDPRDDSPALAAASWPGASLSQGEPSRDRDYTFVSTRALLARPWYRNAVEGDAPVFGKAAVVIDDTWRASVATAVPAGGRYVANIRAATPIDRCFLTAVDSTVWRRHCMPAGFGLHWMSIPLTLAAGRHRFVFRLSSAGGKPNAMLLDGIELVRADTDQQPQRVTRPTIVTYSTNWAISGFKLRPLWLEAARYRVAWFGAGGMPVAGRVSIDGRRVAAEIVLRRSGFHRVSTPPPDAEFLGLFSDGAQPAKSPGNIGRKRSATSWDVGLERPGIVRATVLNDGSWSLDGARGHFKGFDCDLVDTCFGDAPAGQYVLRHRWPPAIVIGLLATALTWIAVCVPCALALLARSARGNAPAFHPAGAANEAGE